MLKRKFGTLRVGGTTIVNDQGHNAALPWTNIKNNKTKKKTQQRVQP